MKKILVFLVILTIVIGLTNIISASPGSSIIIVNIDPERVFNHVKVFSSMGSRITGYPGNYKARDYIINQLKPYFDKIYVLPFKTVVPVDHGSYIIVKVNGEEIKLKAYALAPNLVETCYTSGLTGELVYVKSLYKDLRDFNGKDVKNKIVLMDFDSKDSWRWALYLGAKGVIFIIDPAKKYTYSEDFLKRFWLPIDFPRLAVLKEDIDDILKEVEAGKPISVTMIVNMTLEDVTGYNIIALKYGDKFKDEIIGAFSYYDSWSVIPLLNPGEDDSLSASMLLEVAKTLASRSLKRTLLVGFFAGHYQSLSGIRHFIDYAILNETWKDNILQKIRVVVEVGASAFDYKIGLYDQGHFHISTTSESPALYAQSYVKLLRGWDHGLPTEFKGSWNVIETVVKKLVGEERATEILYFDDYNPITSPLDYIRYFEFEGTSLLQILSFAIGTVSYSPYRFTPSDVLTGTDEELENIRVLATTYASVLNYILEYDYSYPFSEKKFTTNSIRVVVGKTVYYNVTTGLYKPLPNTYVVLAFFPRLLLQQPIGPYVRHILIAKSNATGYFKIPLVIPGSSYMVYAFKDDPFEGPIDWVVDFGEYSTVRGTFTISGQYETYLEVSLFPAGSVVIFDDLDPETMSPGEHGILIIDHYSQNFARYFSFAYELLGFVIHPYYFTGVTVVYINPELANTPRFDIIFTLGGTRWYSLILTNRNKGFYISPSQQLVLGLTVFKSVEDYEVINVKRLYDATRTKLFTDIAQKLHETALRYFNEGSKLVEEKRYYEARGRGLIALALERAAYINLRNLLFDASYSSVFFLLLSIPFAFLLERLLFEFQDIKKRFSTSLAIFIGITLFMYFYHPGFALITNIPLVAVGFLMIILTAFPLIVIMGHAGEAIKEIRYRFIGRHFAEIDKLSALFLSASLSIGNLRRRRLRTSLVIFSIAVSSMAFVSMMSLFSATHVVVVSKYTMDNAYEGILIRQTMPGRFLPPMLAEQLKSIYGDKFVTVITFYVYYPLGERVPIKINITTHEIIGPTALVGLSPEDFKYLPGLKEEDVLNTFFIKGPGPLFESPDDQVCIIPERLAKTLGVDIGDEISVLGIKLKIVGIFREGKDNLYLEYVKDLDNFPVIALAREEEAGGRVTIRSLTPALPSEVIFVPNGIVKKLGGGVFGIRLIYKNPEDGRKIATELATLFNYFVYYSEKGSDGKYYIRQYATVSTQQMVGQEAVMPAVILLSTILSSILGAVHERKKEISILSSVGLSPLHVAGIFLVEFVIVAIIGSFFGYAVGIALPEFINSFLPPDQRLSVNAGSFWVAVAVGLSILVTMLATAYPVRYASKLVTPSLERKWRLEAHAVRRGDTYLVNLPFVIKREEIDGALYYLYEYLSLFRGEEGPFMVDEIGYKEESIPEGKLKTIEMRIKVKPFDWNVVMKSLIQVRVTKKESSWNIISTRLSGTEHIWIRGVRQLTDVVRKQLLMWRALSPSERSEYVKRSKVLSKK